MPDRIATAEIVALDPETLEVDDAFPDAYGFYIRLSTDPGAEWAAEFESAYDALPYPSKPPIVFRGDTLAIFYLPRYADELDGYLAFVERAVTETNASVQRRNAALPDDAAIREAFRNRLRGLAETYRRGR